MREREREKRTERGCEWKTESREKETRYERKRTPIVLFLPFPSGISTLSSLMLLDSDSEDSEDFPLLFPRMTSPLTLMMFWWMILRPLSLPEDELNTISLPMSVRILKEAAFAKAMMKARMRRRDI